MELSNFNNLVSELNETRGGSGKGSTKGRSKFTSKGNKATYNPKKSKVKVYPSISKALSRSKHGEIFSTDSADRLYVTTKPDWGKKSTAGGNNKVAKGFTPGSSTPGASWDSIKDYASRTMKKHAGEKGPGSKAKRQKNEGISTDNQMEWGNRNHVLSIIQEAYLDNNTKAIADVVAEIAWDRLARGAGRGMRSIGRGAKAGIRGAKDAWHSNAGQLTRRAGAGALGVAAGAAKGLIKSKKGSRIKSMYNHAAGLGRDVIDTAATNQKKSSADWKAKRPGEVKRAANASIKDNLSRDKDKFAAAKERVSTPFAQAKKKVASGVGKSSNRVHNQKVMADIENDKKAKRTASVARGRRPLKSRQKPSSFSRSSNPPESRDEYNARMNYSWRENQTLKTIIKEYKNATNRS